MRARRGVLVLAGGLVLATLLANAAAFLHARAFVHYGHYGAPRERTRSPEQLSRLERLAVLVRGASVPRPENARTPADVGLRFDTVHVAGPRGALEAWTIAAPAARGTVLAFPGYAAAKDGLLEVALELHVLGWSCVLVDFAGAGGSEGSTTTLGWREAEDVAALAAAVGALDAARPLVLYGQSMGAAAILRAVAELGVRPDGLVLESPFDTLEHAVETRFRAMGLPAFPGARLLLFWGGRAAGFDARRLAPVQWARAVRCPTLVQWGADDRRVTREQVQAVVAALPGARLVVHPGGGHGALVAQGARWRAEVAAFLAELAEAR